MKAMSTAASTIRHALGAGVEALIILGIIAALTLGLALANGHPGGAASVFAAKGGNGHGNGGLGNAGTSGVTLTVPDGTFGGYTAASVSGASGLWVNVSCQAFSGGGLAAWQQTDASGLAVFQLGPTPSWSAGGASCWAQAGTFDGNGNFSPEASATFTVSG